MVVKTLAGLHGNGIVHGALSPSAVVWHSRDNAMKMCDLCCAATPGELMPISPTLRYAPPEVSQRAPIPWLPSWQHARMSKFRLQPLADAMAIKPSAAPSHCLSGCSSDLIWRPFAESSCQVLSSEVRCYACWLMPYTSYLSQESCCPVMDAAKMVTGKRGTQLHGCLTFC